MPEQNLSLLEKQILFLLLLTMLIQFASGNGKSFTLGDGYRGDRKGHMPGSLHYDRLAQDLNLFTWKDGKRFWHTTDSPEWQALGKYWKNLNPLCRWGGDFESVDLNHFSLEHEGKA